MESVIAAVVVVGLVVILIARTAIVVPQQSAYVIENLGKYSRTISAGFHILIPFVEKVAYRHSLKERAIDIAEQICITKDNVQVGVDGVLYLQGARPAPHFLRHQRLPVRHHAARADDAAQRGGQDRSRSQLRGARHDQHLRGDGARQGLRALGREGAALRDQEHQSADGRAAGDGEADARGAREARHHPRLGGRARRQDQPGRGPEAARDQGVRSLEAAADQRGRGRGRGDPRGGDRDGREPAPHRAGAARGGRRARPWSCASPSATSSSSVTWPARATPSCCPRTSRTSAR